jgi:putative acetyltransferase
MPWESKSCKPSRFAIRLATNGDLPAIRAVLLAVRREFGVVDETDVSDNDLDDLQQNYFRRNGVFEVIEDDGTKRVVGCAGLYPLSPCRAELCKMYILKSARGQGLGKRLLEDLLAAARRNGFAEVWLETNSVLTTATSLYKKYGFEPVSPDQLLPRCDEAYLLRFAQAETLRPAAPAWPGVKRSK